MGLRKRGSKMSVFRGTVDGHHMTSLKTMGIDDGDKAWPSAEFRARYEKGEFKSDCPGGCCDWGSQFARSGRGHGLLRRCRQGRTEILEPFEVRPDQRVSAGFVRFSSTEPCNSVQSSAAKTDACRSVSTDEKTPENKAFSRVVESGWGGIRTPVRLSPKAVFKTAAFDHSATHPLQLCFGQL